MSLEDLPLGFATFFGINETTASLILSTAVIFIILLPTMILTRGKNAPTLWLIMTFFGELITVGFGWLPFWVLIMTIAMTALSFALFGSKGITGE